MCTGAAAAGAAAAAAAGAAAAGVCWRTLLGCTLLGWVEQHDTQQWKQHHDDGWTDTSLQRHQSAAALLPFLALPFLALVLGLGPRWLRYVLAFAPDML
jgi:hypothetical protein